jgi:Rrf2 family protein
MKLSKTSTYALYALGYLAGSDPSGYTPVSTISEQFGLPSTHLAKIFQRLVRAGVLASSRGVSGGFALKKPARELTMLDVVRAVDGPLDEDGCMLEPDRSDEADHCPLHAVWQRGQEAMLAELAGKSVAELGEELVAHARRRRRRERSKAVTR